MRPVHRGGFPPGLLLPLHLLLRLRGAKLLLQQRLLPPPGQGRLHPGPAAQGEEDWGDLEDELQRAAAAAQWQREGVKPLIEEREAKDIYEFIMVVLVYI